jgi:hypothetical protein
MLAAVQGPSCWRLVHSTLTVHSLLAGNSGVPPECVSTPTVLVICSWTADAHALLTALNAAVPDATTTYIWLDVLCMGQSSSASIRPKAERALAAVAKVAQQHVLFVDDGMRVLCEPWPLSMLARAHRAIQPPRSPSGAGAGMFQDNGAVPCPPAKRPHKLSSCLPVQLQVCRRSMPALKHVSP